MGNTMLSSAIELLLLDKLVSYNSLFVDFSLVELRNTFKCKRKERVKPYEGY